MPIDWFTVAAQAINFLILVALLKRFLYGPIVRTIENRERRIVSRMAEAEATRQEAEQLRSEVSQAHSALERDRQRILAEAMEEARAKQREWLASSRQDLVDREAEWYDDLKRRQELLLDQLARHSHQHVITALENGLAQLADVDLQERIVAVFVQQLKELALPQLKVVKRRAGDGQATIRSATALSSADQQCIRQVVEGLSVEPSQLRFETQPSLICGIELRVDGQCLCWSLRRYIDELDQALKESLQAVVPVGLPAADRDHGPTFEGTGHAH